MVLEKWGVDSINSGIHLISRSSVTIWLLIFMNYGLILTLNWSFTSLKHHNRVDFLQWLGWVGFCCCWNCWNSIFSSYWLNWRTIIFSKFGVGVWFFWLGDAGRAGNVWHFFQLILFVWINCRQLFIEMILEILNLLGWFSICLNNL